LSPILGLEGYQTILNEMKTMNLQFQYMRLELVYDIPALMETGIYGIAVSGLIHNQNKKRQSNNLNAMEPSLFKIGDKILSRLFLGTGKFGSNTKWKKPY
jgi:hypothetical protein